MIWLPNWAVPSVPHGRRSMPAGSQKSGRSGRPAALSAPDFTSPAASPVPSSIWPGWKAPISLSQLTPIHQPRSLKLRTTESSVMQRKLYRFFWKKLKRPKNDRHFEPINAHLLPAGIRKGVCCKTAAHSPFSFFCFLISYTRHHQQFQNVFFSSAVRPSARYRLNSRNCSRLFIIP